MNAPYVRREAQLSGCTDEKQLSGIVASALTRTVAVAQVVSTPSFHPTAFANTE
jgi:hypothetical protein